MSHPDYKLLIFDWDGTLCDSIGRIVESMHMASTRSGFEPCEDLAVKGIIGLSLAEAIRTLYPQIGDDDLVAFRQHYADYYMALDAEPSPLFEGWCNPWMRCVARAITSLLRPARRVVAWIECSRPMAGAIISMPPVRRMKQLASPTR